MPRIAPRLAAADAAITLPATLAIPSVPDKAATLIAAAERLLTDLSRGQLLDARSLRLTMEAAFGGSDADGAWVWKDAYEACEVAQLLFLRRFGAAMQAKAPSPAALVVMLEKLAALLPTQTRRSEESQEFQQFSTPFPLGMAVGVAAALTPNDVVLEPSAGTGLLAIFAERAGARLALNELAETRADLLVRLFPGVTVTRHDAARIHDRLDTAVRPSVIVMNPPFSALAHVENRTADTALRHMASALARLAEGGRLVAVTGASQSPDNPSWREHFIRLQERGRIVFSGALDGAAYARHGTHFDTRLTVIDRVPADDPAVLPDVAPKSGNVVELLDKLLAVLPPRPNVTGVIGLAETVSPTVSLPLRRIPAPVPRVAASASPSADVIELAYETLDWKPVEGGRLTDALYEGYALQSLHIPVARPHPTRLVQSAAMASVAPPKPTYRPHLPAKLVENGLLSDAQLESVIYAGEAHAGHLDGHWLVDSTFDTVSAAAEDSEGSVRFRRGWFLGDGTGAGKGRQVAGILLDNWLKGHRRAVWISKSDKLIEDAQRDWSALGQERLQITPLSRFRQGTSIRLAEGILFTTYATLRSGDKEDKASRVRQIVDWLGQEAGSGEAATGKTKSFEGVIVFDEAHAMRNAGGGKSERGDVAPSRQGRAGLRLQQALPDARVLYVSATGATTVQNLAYAQRLGLWGGADFPFATRGEFVQAVEAGGVAAMEVLARDLKALGLYTARSLSYEGVEYEMLDHRLTAEQTRIYDAYAGAFQIIHNNLSAALEAANVTSRSGTLNGQAKAAARSAFESAKQRFFNHLITAMKTPTLIAAIDRDQQAGHASVIQLVSTGEALMERRLAEIPTSEWSDVSVDITPREYVLDYLAHSFPTQLFEPFTDADGNLLSRPAFQDGQPVQCREAMERRDRLIEHLAALPPVQGALDQLIQRFGADQVAEVTGRSRRIVRTEDGRLKVENRAASANLGETQAFMDDAKRILVFSDAGGTGRSYHADNGAKNRRLRVHYLLEAGWKADAAIQGLGRTNRTNQAQPPLFRPIATDVKAEKRFLSTIARRLDTLGAITKGQRQTGGQGLFRAEDNLESVYARVALRQLYGLLFAGKVEDCSLERFQDATGLDLLDGGGTLREDLPPVTTFLNRLLALSIGLQNVLFGVFDDLLAAGIEGAMASGGYDAGVETLTADSLTVTDRRIVYIHPASGAETRIFSIARRERNHPTTLVEALRRAGEPGAQLLVNRQSGRAAVRVAAPSLMLDDGRVERRARLIRPMERPVVSLETLEHSHWQLAERDAFAAAWEQEVAATPEFTDSEIRIVTGLLLPIWRRLPTDNCRVYRLQTNDGERIIGRLIPPHQLAELCESLGAGTAPVLSAGDGWRAVTVDGATLHLADGLAVRRSLVMGLQRVELTGFTDGMVARLKALGLIGEIIQWRLRLFIPVTPQGAGILDTLLERHPLLRIVPRG